MATTRFDVGLWVSRPRMQEPETYTGSGLFGFPVFVIPFFVFVELLCIAIFQTGCNLAM